MKKFLFLAVALLSLTVQNASAVSLTFQFDVNSSGPSMYACNAGIQHTLDAKVCYDKVAGQTCSPACAQGDISACSANTSPATCACTGEENGNQGGSFMDFANVNYGAWSDNQDSSTAPLNKKLSGGFGYDWSSLFPMNTGAYGTQIKDLTINLGSEIYGAEYFVDICYRGSQIDYTGLDALNFSLLAKVTVTNLKNETNYQDLSKLKVKAETKCVMQDAFNYCSFDNIPGLDLCGSAESHNATFSSGDPRATTAQQLSLINVGTMGQKSSRAPKFCYTRYSFSETSKTVRKWKEQKARICTYTQISENESEE